MEPYAQETRHIPTLATSCKQSLENSLLNQEYDIESVKIILEYAHEHKIEIIQKSCLQALYQKARKKNKDFDMCISWIQKIALNNPFSELFSQHIAIQSAHILRTLLQCSDAKLVANLKGHEQALEAMTVFAHGKRLASASNDYTMRIWNLETNELLQTVTTKGQVSALAAFPDQERIVFATHNPMILYCRNVETNKETVLQNSDPKLAPTNQFYTKNFLQEGERIHLLEVSPKGTIAFCSYKFILYLFDSTNNQKLQSIRYPKKRGYNFNSTLAFFPDENKIAYTCDNEIFIKEPDKETLSLTGHPCLITTIKISKDGTTLISGDNDKTIIIWNAHLGTAVHKLTYSGSYISGLALFSNKSLFLDSAGYLRDYNTGATLNMFDSSYFGDMILLPCQKKIITRCHSTMSIYSLVDDELINNVKDPLVWLLLEYILTHEISDEELKKLKRYESIFMKLPEIIRDQLLSPGAT